MLYDRVAAFDTKLCPSGWLSRMPIVPGKSELPKLFSGVASSTISRVFGCSPSGSITVKGCRGREINVGEVTGGQRLRKAVRKLRLADAYNFGQENALLSGRLVPLKARPKHLIRSAICRTSISECGSIQIQVLLDGRYFSSAIEKPMRHVQRKSMRRCFRVRVGPSGGTPI